MRLSAPRIAPLDLDRLDADQQAALAPVRDGRLGVLNIFRTLAHAPKALTAFLGWGSYILSRRNALPPRERELAILRTGFACGAGYEWTQHVPIGLDAGLNEAEILAIKQGPDEPSWSAIDRAILTACDELTRDFHVSDATWAALAPLGEKARMDLVMTVGQYSQVSMMLNSFGVQLDPGQTLDPDLDRR
ncbi:carboxymuconolactone decarboxylase family protein [Novosphingobium sp. Gsoil 351]|uniref:carboxymuconolactone decarboxylase family protein n=1 Tax=Novosphingobium sp. Gsoil 351 TaxID=2675225 RepID=UPI0012B49DB3|nr:carboxymuconolactone decarboxylase family protein [Novosphingobium sp. Gsoil 351]QGN54722.1 carboxymuconolactone decarboxylase family protein [Novosphingobium sp. Gsoil 351]